MHFSIVGSISIVSWADYVHMDINMQIVHQSCPCAILKKHALQVEELYVMFNNEARDLAQLPPVTRVKLNKRVLDTIFQEGCCLYIHAGSSLKSPSATDDSPKVCHTCTQASLQI